MKYPRTVYLLRHNKTNRIYIGSSYDPSKRVERHLVDLRRGKHPVEDMQADFDQYGGGYTVELLDVITTYGENKKEYEWQERLNSHIRGVGYNYKDFAGRKRERSKNPNKTKLKKVIESLTDEQAEEFLAYLEAHK